MSQQRIDYFRDLTADYQSLHLHDDFFNAFVLSDSMNGVRKALLEIQDSLRESAKAQSKINDRLADLQEQLERKF